MDAKRVTEHIVNTLDERGMEYDYDGILECLQRDPDKIYDRLIDLGNEQKDPIRFYALAEFVVDYEKEYF